MESFAFDSLIEAIGGSSDPHAIMIALRNFAKECGFDWFAYIDAAGQDVQAFSNYPREWQQHYLSREYSLIDPVMIEARKRTAPFAWDKQTNRARFSKRQRDFFEEAAEFGIRSGIAIPIFTGFGRTALLSLASSGGAAELPLVRDPAKATAAATYLHIYLQMVLSGVLVGKDYKLTARQIACLKWAASNKTHREIGEILNIGESAVRKHLDKAKEILGAGGIKSAIYIATKNCLI